VRRPSRRARGALRYSAPMALSQGPNGEKRQITTKTIEDPGRYFNPLLGVLIRVLHG